MPFASDFLIQTIKENKYRVVSTAGARALLPDEELTWVSEKVASRLIRENPEMPLYTNSENALNWLENHLGGSSFAKHAQLFKDKVRFRELIHALYPGFFYKRIQLEDIQGLKENELPFPFVIKPSIGFFSIGVHVVKNASDWEVAKKELNYGSLRSIYPRNVLDTSTFIMEEYIEGEEFAIDCYFNNTREVVILNIMHHRFSSGADTSDRVYTTSKDIIHTHLERFRSFLQTIGDQAELRNFPAHVELRLDSSGHINPIEINPLRFGGWCTTADLLGIATGANPYDYYLQKRKPDWDRVFEGKSQKMFSIVVLNNNSGYAPEKIDRFDYELLAMDFEKPLEIRRMDVQQYSVFGFVFAETSPENEQELDKILVSDLRKYITLK
ncbi:MAG: ATP-grasp domain-containing protein [Bacteroidota bacterium]|nr:ATP-grasp domain-containing protein [Bacteroidota bacterium]